MSSLTAPAAEEPGSRQTREFVQAAAQSDEFEILAATTVLAQSEDPKVRAFAQQMIDAHRKTSADLRAAVSAAGLNPPKPGMSGEQSMFLAALQSQRGTEFDKVYIKQQALAHRAALAVEQAYAASGDNAAIRKVAAAAVPVITSHLQMADQMQAATGS
ncbi:putative membrane protein [Sphingomonas vulcanisoli]|uniref:Membrane protein n=1 Tax=Sphingomonas vulcanisoli TaxID=1658060 RepID=A0ABX0TYM4_9SPHN|nr:DUF4142 domain-containing protein [Sphingomonas vulcanisoli]NIJ09480.1 putative membrane protein [Sphingomonas vulcanisoli]